MAIILEVLFLSLITMFVASRYRLVELFTFLGKLYRFADLGRFTCKIQLR